MAALEEEGRGGGDGRGVMATVIVATKEARAKNSIPNMNCTVSPNPLT